jgi:phosphate starvation-inducible PhoH-like protein
MSSRIRKQQRTTKKKNNEETGRRIQLTENQYEFSNLIEDDYNQIIVCTGPAGTAKTFVTMYSSLNLLKRGDYDKIILTKPAQESGEKLGFLPGDINEKIAPYMESFVLTLEKLTNKMETKLLIDKGVIEARPLAYMRGSTFDRTIMILDEAQNCDLRQLILFVTRMGETSKIIICGDVEQYDIAKNQSGLLDFIRILNGVNRSANFTFGREDIVRSKILIEVTDNYNKWKMDNGKL